MFSRLSNYFAGRHTMFAVYFAVAGTVLSIFHRLDPNFVALCATLQTLVLAHSYKEDRNNTKDADKA